MLTITAPGPHAGGRILVQGRVESARAAAVLLHGRGATAESILTLADEIALDDVAWLAPQAAGRTWYPYRFLEPVERNEPWLSGALAVVEEIVLGLLGRGFTADRIGVLGFSQGGCLTLEFAVRHPRPYGALVALSGGLIGPPGTTWPAPSDLAGARVFLGCGDRDDHIPVDRVRESSEIFERTGAEVTAIIYPGMPHIVNEDELQRVREMFTRMTAARRDGT